MEEAGMDAYIDKVANVRGRVRGLNPEAPILLSGSHYDTVKDAGKYDGMLGILVPIAAIKAMLIQVHPLVPFLAPLSPRN
jgi:acetylornithine deacetylase/succinyl-diaminopimelate desuccinylase-like protein